MKLKSFIFLIVIIFSFQISHSKELKIGDFIYNSETGQFKEQRTGLIVLGVLLPLRLDAHNFNFIQSDKYFLLHADYKYYLLSKNGTDWSLLLESENTYARQIGQIVDHLKMEISEKYEIYLFSSYSREGGFTYSFWFDEFMAKSFPDDATKSLLNIIQTWMTNQTPGLKLEEIIDQMMPEYKNFVEMNYSTGLNESLMFSSKRIEAPKVESSTPLQSDLNETSPEVATTLGPVETNTEGSIQDPALAVVERFPNIPMIRIKDEDGSSTSAWTKVESISDDFLKTVENDTYEELPELRKVEDQILKNLIKFENSSVKLLAPSGVGKTTLMRRLGYRFLIGDIPKELMTYRFRTFSADRIQSGTMYRGSVESRINAITEISKHLPIIWFVDEAHALAGAGATASRESDVLQSLKPLLGSGELKMIMATTPEEWNQAYANDPAFDRRFTRVDMKTPSGDDLVNVLNKWLERNKLEPLSRDLIEKIIFYSDEFGIEGAQPSKATKLLNQLYANKKFETVGSSVSSAVSLEDVKKAVQDLYGVDPSEFEVEVMRKRFLDLESALENLVGQDKAKMALLDSTKQVMTGVYDRTKPRYRLVFAGPKGQGKTEIVKLFSKAMGLPEGRIMMSEYTQSHQIEEFKAQIAKLVRINPLTILFFDEFEKAHPGIQKVLLGVLDEGKISYSSVENGTYKILTLMLKNTSPFISTNAGTDYINKIKGDRKLGFGKSEPQTVNSTDLFNAMVSDGVDPFVLDRTSQIVVFSYLTPEQKKEVLKLKTIQMIKTLEQNLNVKIYFTNLDLFAEQIAKSEDTESSNRDLIKAIDKNLRQTIANQLFSTDQKVISLEWKDTQIRVVEDSALKPTAKSCEGFLI